MDAKLLGFATQIMAMTALVSVVLLLVAIGVLVLVHACSIRSTALMRGLGGSGRGGGGLIGSGMAAGDVQKGLSQDEVEKLPCFEFKVEVGAKPSDCAVCLESFLVGERCRLLPSCRHSFHAQCVDSWLLKNSMCPICRASADLGEGPSAADCLGVTSRSCGE